MLPYSESLKVSDDIEISLPSVVGYPPLAGNYFALTVPPRKFGINSVEGLLMPESRGLNMMSPPGAAPRFELIEELVSIPSAF